MREGSESDRARIRKAIEEGGKQDLAQVVETIHRTGALEYARQRAREEAATATARLEHLPASACRESLMQLAFFSVERKF
jgi:octaprenyl-diphosphate synthase